MTATRVILLLACATSLALAFVQPASAWYRDNENCETVGPGVVACGRADAAPCAVTGSGAATAPVMWRLVGHGSDTGNFDDTFFGAAYAGTVPVACTTGTCVTAYLYANGVLIWQSMTVC